MANKIQRHRAQWAMKSGVPLLLIACANVVGELPAQQSDAAERILYLVDRPDALASFARHVEHISVIAPQSFAVDALGAVAGKVDPEVAALARAHAVPVMPLIVNPNWNRALIHEVLAAPAARKRLIERLVQLGVGGAFWGWQLDFENVAPADRQLLTQLVRDAATALHARGLKLSIAVPVPDREDAPSAYDVGALAAAADFISIMTYDQHTSDTTPGPVAGVPWVERTVQWLLNQNVAPAKLSLGIPFFSMHWFTAMDSAGKRTPSARGLAFARGDSLRQHFKAPLLWDDAQQTHHATWENAGTLEHLYLEDARSFEAKLRLAERYRLRGISIWRIGQEDPRVWRVMH